MMKNKLQIALTTLFGVLVFCFWLFVRPAVIMEREALQLFLWNGDYLAERLAVPGGFARYVGEFLVQYFLFETAGAAILAVVLSAVSWFFWILIHRSIPSVSDKILFPISFLPAIVLWLLMCDMDTSMTLPVAVLLTLVLMLLLPEKKTPSLFGSIALVPVGYLPQRNPKEYYRELLYSYNTPDFTSRPVKMDAREMGRRLESPKRQSTRTDWR
jgi:uncharacterized membrane protein YecN with MAPEG domain